MLRDMQEIKSYAIGATDGEIGHVCDLLFDDQNWVVRYLVVETGSWLLRRKVLMSPLSLADADWEHKRLPVHVSKEQVKNSPDVDTEKPISRQHELLNANHYGYPYYWVGEDLNVPVTSPEDYLATRAQAVQRAPDDLHLRSVKSVTGYHVHALDGDIGHVSTVLVDEDSWVIRYLVVDTSNWWLGHQVLVPPEWALGVSWTESKVSIDLTRTTIKNSPRYESSVALNRAQETDLYHHYGRLTYWDREHARELLAH